MADSSFDIVSEISWQELNNAVDQAKREIANRFDFKGTQCSLDLKDKELNLVADDELKLDQLKDVFHSKLVRRGIPIKVVTYLKEEGASGGTKRQKATFISGIDAEHCKKINASIKNQKFKVKSQTMDAKVRVTAKSRDELQKVISYLKKENFKVPLQFTNYH